jgi:hypothetical protein
LTREGPSAIHSIRRRKRKSSNNEILQRIIYLFSKDFLYPEIALWTTTTVPNLVKQTNKQTRFQGPESLS